MKFTATSLKTKKTKQVSKGISKESQPELYNISKAIGTLDLDIIDNPNIQSKNVVKSKKQKTDKSFPNEDDPFYTINKQKEESRTNKASINKMGEKASKTRKLVVDLSTTETTTQSKTTTGTATGTMTVGSRQSTGQITRQY